MIGRPVTFIVPPGNEAGERFVNDKPAGFLHKPFRLDTLRQMLEQALS